MAHGYKELHRGTNEWSRKIRKASEGRRLRHAARRAMHAAAQDRAFGADDLESRRAVRPGFLAAE